MVRNVTVFLQSLQNTLLRGLPLVYSSEHDDAIGFELIATVSALATKIKQTLSEVTDSKMLNLCFVKPIALLDISARAYV